MSSEESSAPDERPQPDDAPKQRPAAGGQRPQGDRAPARGGDGSRKPYARDGRDRERKPYRGEGRDGERQPYRGEGRDGERQPYRGEGRDGERKPYRGGNRAGQRTPDRGGSGGRPRDDRGPRRSDDARSSRPPRERADRPPEPVLPEDVSWDQLDREARARLRTLSKTNAELVGAHLVMAGRLLEDDAERAYEHAQAAVRRAGRVDVVREAAALTAYATGRYAEALRELRTVRRLSGVDAHRAIEADCERGLGRPDRALAIVAEAPSGLSADEQVELAIVASGARQDLGENEAALSVLERADRPGLSTDAAERLAEARQAVLVVLGRAEAPDAEAPPKDPATAAVSEDDPSDDDIVAVDDVLEGR